MRVIKWFESQTWIGTHERNGFWFERVSKLDIVIFTSQWFLISDVLTLMDQPLYL